MHILTFARARALLLTASVSLMGAAFLLFGGASQASGATGGTQGEPVRTAELRARVQSALDNMKQSPEPNSVAEIARSADGRVLRVGDVVATLEKVGVKPDGRPICRANSPMGIGVYPTKDRPKGHISRVGLHTDEDCVVRVARVVEGTRAELDGK